jgi:hypothetical protein
MAKDSKKAAQMEAEMAQLEGARLSLMNKREPTTADKIVSALPYLLPLLDGLKFGRFLLAENSDNPVVGILGLLYTVYRSIPLSGFLAYLALNFLSSNLSLNRLVRFNMQQAMFVNIALFLPGLLAVATSFIASGTGFEIPQGVTELGSNFFLGPFSSPLCTHLSVPPSASLPIKSHLFHKRLRTACQPSICLTKVVDSSHLKCGMVRKRTAREIRKGK